jgi:cobalt/nickel transport system ATP-binding protein
MEPEAILFDEPSAYLDCDAKKRMVSVIKKLPQTKIIASQDIQFCCKVCNRVVLLRKGKIRGDFAMDKLKENAALLRECGVGAS